MYVDLCILAEIAQRAYMYGLGDVLKYLTKYIQNLVFKKSQVSFWSYHRPNWPTGLGALHSAPVRRWAK